MCGTDDMTDGRHQAEEPFSDLRAEAEGRVDGDSGGELPVAPTTEDIRALFHDLKVHQAELEIQNDSLREAQRELERSRDRYSRLYNQAPVGYMTVDASGIVVQANATLHTLLGAEQGSLLHKSFSRFIYPGDQPVFFGRFRAFYKNPGRKHLDVRLASAAAADDVRHVRLEGRRVAGLDSVPESAEPVDYLLVSVSDVTVEKRADTARREALSDLRGIFNAGVPLSRLDREFTVVEVNDVFYAPLGIDRAGAVGRKCYELWGGPHCHTADCPLRRIINGTDQVEYEKILESVDGGEPRTFLMKSRPFRDVDGNIDGMVESYIEVTERKRAEARLREQEAQLRHSQKLEAVGTLAGGIAHDFNNILFPIIGYTEMAQDGVDSETPAYRYLGEIFKAALRARELVQQILTFSRRDEHEVKPVRIQSIVKETVKLLRSSMPINVNLAPNLDEDSEPVMADPTRIHQVLMNLCTNAYHAMRETGGSLEIDLTRYRVKAGDPSAPDDLAPGRYVRLTVRDNGVGIADEVRDRIFDPYFTTRETGEGTGLGLSVVLGIVEEYGGRISVESAPGYGTAFDIYFPAAISRGEDDESEAEAKPAAPGGKERVLLVDDELQVLDMLRSHLERLGYTVFARSDGEDALATFRSRRDEVDLVITDMSMPGRSGAALAQAILAIDPKKPIILCTGFSAAITEEAALEMGIRAFVMKPVVLREMAETIRAVLDSAEC